MSYETLTLTDSQKERYGKDSEIYELRLETKDKKAIDVKQEEIEQKLQLDPNKKFVAVYQITADGSIVRLNHELGENNELVFKSNGLGKYIISYQTDDDANDTNVPTNEGITKPSMSEDESNSLGDTIMNYLPYIIGGLVIIIGGSMFFILKKKS